MVAAATALVAGVVTILMGVVANFPLALATGLGLNAFVAFSIAVRDDAGPDAMGLVVLEGLIILVLVLTGFRTAVFHAVPPGLKTAISVGIGLFIAFIGLVDAGFVRRNPDAANTPVPVEFGVGGELAGWPMLVFVRRPARDHRDDGAQGEGRHPHRHPRCHRARRRRRGHRRHRPELHRAREASTRTAGASTSRSCRTTSSTPRTSGCSATSACSARCDRVGVVAAVAVRLHPAARRLLRHDGHDDRHRRRGRPARRDGRTAERPADPGRRLDRGRGRWRRVGVVSNTSYIESASGVGEGARTGLASVVTGVLFLLATFLSPLVTIVPYEAATPALVVVGFLMMQQVRGIDWDDSRSRSRRSSPSS